MPDINNGMQVKSAGSGALLAALLMRRRRSVGGRTPQNQSTDPRMYKEYWENQTKLNREESENRQREAAQRHQHEMEKLTLQGAVRMTEKEQQAAHAKEAGEDLVANSRELHALISDTGGSVRAGNASVTLPIKKTGGEEDGVVDNASRNAAFTEDQEHPEATNLDGVDTNAEPGAETKPERPNPNMWWIQGVNKPGSPVNRRLAPKKRDTSQLAELQRRRPEYQPKPKLAAIEGTVEKAAITAGEAAL